MAQSISNSTAVSLSQQLIHPSVDAIGSDHYVALLAQQILQLEQQVLRSSAAVSRAGISRAGVSKMASQPEQTEFTRRLGLPTDFIAADTRLTAATANDEQAQQLLQQFVLQYTDQAMAQAYLTQLRQHLAALTAQCQPRTLSSKTANSTPFQPSDLPSYATLCGLLPACFAGFWAAVSPIELAEHSQQPLLAADGLVNVYPPTPEQRAEAKALLQTFTPAQHTAVAGLCQTLQRVYRLTWQRDFKPIILGSAL